MLLYLIFGFAFAQQQDLCNGDSCLTTTSREVIPYNDAGEAQNAITVTETIIKPEISNLFSDKFRCFLDSAGAYDEWSLAFYGGNMNADPCCKDENGAPKSCNDDGTASGQNCQRTTSKYYYCCGYMANGRRQCDRIEEWKKVGDSHFTLCETNYASAVSEGTTANPKLRRDLCCENDEFNDCNLCKSFVVWDFTVDADSHGGDVTMEKEYKNNMNLVNDVWVPKYTYNTDTANIDHPDQEAMKDTDNTNAGKVFLQNDWRDLYYGQGSRTVEYNGKDVDYPEYAYDNLIHPAGFARATLREFNDPPVCVYVPNVGGRVIEVRVEPEESGSQVCVDDLHEDSLERNAPGVTQACDDSRLQTCFPDANTSEESSGFAFLISCAESCADSDLDLWFRVRSSVNRWVDNGKFENGVDVAPGSDQTEVATEMWCMWGNADMRDENGDSTLPDDFPGFSDLDGNFAKWDIYASDLAPPEDPQVQPMPDNALALSVGILLSMVALLF